MSEHKQKVSQTKKFIETAKKLGCDESEDALDTIIGRLDLKRQPVEKLDKIDKKLNL